MKLTIHQPPLTRLTSLGAEVPLETKVVAEPDLPWAAEETPWEEVVELHQKSRPV